MDYDLQFRKSLEKMWASDGGESLRSRLANGTFHGPQAEFVKAFVSEKQQERLTAYLLGPEYSALRQANAAEQSNKTARQAFLVSLIAAVMAFAALLLQVWTMIKS